MNAFCPDSEKTVGRLGKKMLERKEGGSVNVALHQQSDGRRSLAVYFLNTLGLPWEPSHSPAGCGN